MQFFLLAIQTLQVSCKTHLQLQCLMTSCNHLQGLGETCTTLQVGFIWEHSPKDLEESIRHKTCLKMELRDMESLAHALVSLAQCACVFEIMSSSESHDT